MSNTFLSAFNNLVLKFNDDLISTFPEENDFKVYKRGIMLLNIANSKKICLLFKDYMVFYRQKITEKDESFFLNKLAQQLNVLLELYKANKIHSLI